MIFAKHHNAGLCNQVLALEIAVGLSHLLHDVTIYGFGRIEKRKDNFYNSFVVNKDLQDIFITDLFDVPDINLNFIREMVIKEDDGQRLYNFYASVDGKDNLDFADGRILLSRDEDYYFPDIFLATYCRIFANRTKEFDQIIAAVKPKQEYLDLAEAIASSLGKFNGVHLRRGDHTPVVDVPGSAVDEARSRFKEALPILLATDDVDSVKLYSDIIIAEQYILLNFLTEFEALPRHDENVLALLVNLVMHYAEEFIGTRTSTYTGYIHRNRLISRGDDSMLFLNNGDHKKESQSIYSWDGFSMTHLEKNYREWKEAIL